MKDNYISRAAVISTLLWSAALTLVATTWALAAQDRHLRWMGAVAITAVLCMAAASVCQIRLYVLRVCGLIRISAGLESPNAEVTPLNR